jgi:hypothetical protein
MTDDAKPKELAMTTASASGRWTKWIVAQLRQPIAIRHSSFLISSRDPQFHE